MDFPVTREIIQDIEEPVNAMAALLPRPERKLIPNGGFFWLYPVESAEVVQVAKAVRMASGLHAAWRLAEEGLVAECYTILRTVADFALEIAFIAEGIMDGQFNTSQKTFIDQFFVPFPTDRDEFAVRARGYYVRRDKMIAARIRLLHKGSGSEEIARMMAFINKTFDSYVHGAYLTAMELFSGETYTFMIGGHESLEKRSVVKMMVAAKLFEALVALELMARTRKIPELVRKIGADRQRLLESSEGSPFPEASVDSPS